MFVEMHRFHMHSNMMSSSTYWLNYEVREREIAGERETERGKERDLLTNR